MRSETLDTSITDKPKPPKEERITAAVREFENMVREHDADMVTIVTFKGRDPAQRKVRHLKLAS